MCGEHCLVGSSSLEAWDVLTKVPLNVEFVLTRRKEIPELMGTPSSSSPSTAARPTSRPISVSGLKRRMSYSLHFPSRNPSTEDLSKGDANYDNDGDEEDSSVKQEPEKPAITMVEDKFTVILTRDDNSQKLGLGIHGGVDNPTLPEIYVCWGEYMYVAIL